MREIAGLAAVCALLGVAAPVARAEQPSDRGHKTIFEVYCSGCHDLNAAEGTVPIDVSRLVTKYGAPLPNARLLEMVLSERRGGGSRVCGEHVSWLVPPQFERATVRAALQYVADFQNED
jgi:hypothetical protein